LIWQRTILVIIAAACLVGGLVLATANSNPQNISGILIRVGLMLAVTSFALPHFYRTGSQTGARGDASGLSTWVFVAGLAGAALIATRPRVFLIAFLLLATAVVTNWVMRRLTPKQSAP
jgi:hypothetical protein